MVNHPDVLMVGAGGFRPGYTTHNANFKILKLSLGQDCAFKYPKFG